MRRVVASIAAWREGLQMTGETAGGGGRIVVGVDESPGSVIALRWALVQALLTGAVVEVVMVWSEPGLYDTGYGWATTAGDPDGSTTIMEQRLAGTVAEAQQPDRLAEVRVQVLRGHPALGSAGGRGRGTVARRGQPRAQHGRRCAARLGQRALCPACAVPGGGGPGPGGLSRVASGRPTVGSG